ncbi:MAG: hypothetical protein IKL96_07490, partial [Kiritimatiellae bacterium]|nr:hypothetical protein [Kiritimatiellia bacterium]
AGQAVYVVLIDAGKAVLACLTMGLLLKPYGYYTRWCQPRVLLLASSLPSSIFSTSESGNTLFFARSGRRIMRAIAERGTLHMISSWLHPYSAAA